MPDREREALAALVAQVHARGRKLRFWGGPDTAAVWDESYAAGVDLINTDSLSALERHFSDCDSSPARTIFGGSQTR